MSDLEDYVPDAPAAAAPSKAAAAAPKRFSAKQIEALEEAFDMSPNPSGTAIAALAAAIKDDETRIRGWFGRKRAAMKKATDEATAAAERKRKAEESAVAEAERDRASKLLKQMQTSTDTEFLRAELLKAVGENDALKAELAGLRAVASAAKALQESTAAAAAAAAAARVANAARDAASARAFVVRSIKEQMRYQGGTGRLRAHIPNLSAEAFALVAGDRGRSFDVASHDFYAVFSACAPSKGLRYGSVLAPVWPLHCAFNAGGFVVSGQYAMFK